MSTVTLTSGLTLHYTAQGDPAGVPVILLHGLSDSHRSYEPMLAHLPYEIRAYALTTRGHGDSDKPEHCYDPATLAADVAGFMDAVGIIDAVIVGPSAGTYTAQQLAIDHPGRVRGLVLIGAVWSGSDHAVLNELNAIDYSDPVDPIFVREFQLSTLRRPVPTDYFGMVVAESLKLPAAVWRAAVRDIVDSEAPISQGVIHAPTLLLWGEYDDVCPREDQERLAAEIPAEVIVYEGHHHAAHWEDPLRAAADVASFSLRGRLRPRSGAVR
jgi:non-heme chloroperoxidase